MHQTVFKSNQFKFSVKNLIKQTYIKQTKQKRNPQRCIFTIVIFKRMLVLKIVLSSLWHKVTPHIQTPVGAVLFFLIDMAHLFI